VLADVEPAIAMFVKLFRRFAVKFGFVSFMF
jgi:hypothetical protein